jgi:CBS domain-containing protein
MGICRVGFGAAAAVRVAAPVPDAEWARRGVTSAHALDPDALLSVAPETPCVEADDRARQCGVRHLFVRRGGQVVGVLCRCDLYPEPDEQDVVAGRMTTTVYALEADATLGEAAAAMCSLGVGCLALVRDDAPVGVITRGDLRRAGVPEERLGAHRCAECGSLHGVRSDAHAGLDYCLDCIDLFDALAGPRDLGEGD